MSVQDINAQMAASLAAQSGETPEDVAQRVNANEADKASKLSAMLAQASAAKSEAGVKAPKAAKAPKEPKAPKAVKESTEQPNSADDSRNRRNKSVLTRNIYVFTSPSLKSKFVSTNLLFDGQIPTKQVELLQQRKKPSASTRDFLTVTDMICETLAVDVPFGNELDQAKATYHDQFVAQGWTMINNRPKVNAVEPEVVSTPTTEQVSLVDSDVSATV